MSYCVNCGVELDEGLPKCPLCNTVVINPNDKRETDLNTTFPNEKGITEPVRRTDIAILVAIVLGCSSIACILLNLLVFKSSLWSVYIVGACVGIWIFFIPILIYSKLPVIVYLAADCITVIAYCTFIAYNHPGNGWLTDIAIPIDILLTVLIFLLIILSRVFKHSILPITVVVFIEITVFCIGIDLSINYYLSDTLKLTWSTIVLTTCFIIDVTLITITKHSRLREEVRKRAHL